MPDLVPGFVKVTEAGIEYKTSRSTLDRRREAARTAGNAKFYRVFRLRAKNGEVFDRPSKEQVAQLTKAGRVPEWFVSRSWLAKEFGKRDEEPQDEPAPQGATHEPDRSSELSAAVRYQLEERIKDLKEQLEVERQEKKELLQYAQADKQMFAQAAHQLTQVLALPAIAEANKNRSKQAVPGTAQSSKNLDDPSVDHTTPSQSKRSPEKRARWQMFKLFKRS
jgi:hypothetical protein